MTEQYKKRILVVDDEISYCNSISKILTIEGYSTKIYSKSYQNFPNISKDIEKSELKEFDLAIIDYVLGHNITGFEISKDLKEINPNIFILLMSGFPQSVIEDKLQIENCNFIDDFISKPFVNEKIFLKKIQRSFK